MLNDAKIRAAKAREKAYKLTDSHRLYLLVKPGGSKLWKWSYAYDGKQKTMHFGIYPMVTGLTAIEGNRRAFAKACARRSGSGFPLRRDRESAIEAMGHDVLDPLASERCWARTMDNDHI